MSYADLLSRRAVPPVPAPKTAREPRKSLNVKVGSPGSPGSLAKTLNPIENTLWPCQCGSGTFHQTDGSWLCSACHPRTGTPAAVLTVPGGHTPAGPSRDVDLVLREAVLGLPITADEFRAWCDPDDLADIAAGLIPVATVRAYAWEAVRQGPRELGATVGGVRVQTYRRDCHETRTCK